MRSNRFVRRSRKTKRSFVRDNIKQQLGGRKKSKRNFVRDNIKQQLGGKKKGVGRSNKSKKNKNKNKNKNKKSKSKKNLNKVTGGWGGNNQKAEEEEAAKVPLNGGGWGARVRDEPIVYDVNGGGKKSSSKIINKYFKKYFN